MGNNEPVQRWGLAASVIGVFAGGAVHANRPSGLFGDYDIPVRAVVTGTVTAQGAEKVRVELRRRRAAEN